MSLRRALLVLIGALLVSEALSAQGPSVASPITNHTAPLTSGPSPTVPISRDWKSARSPHFVLLGNASEKNVRSTLTDLEQFRAALLQLFPGMEIAPSVPTYIVLFRDDAAMTPYKPRTAHGRIDRNVAGYFEAQDDVTYMVTASGYEEYGVNTIFHEYTHYIVHRNLARVPTWIDEGLAEFYSTFKVDSKGQGIIGLTTDRALTFRDGSTLLALDRIVTDEGTAKTFRNEEWNVYYAQAWLMVHYMSVGNRAGQLASYLRALRQGQAVRDAFRSTFGVSFEQMRQELRRYLQQVRLPAGVLKLPVEATEPRITFEPVKESDVQALQGDLLMRLGDDEAAEKALNRALVLEPGHVRANLALAGVRIHGDKHADALALLDPLERSHPDDFAVQYWHGRALMRGKKFELATEAFSQATRLNPQVPGLWLALSNATLAIDRKGQSNATFTLARQLDSSPGLLRARAASAYTYGKWDTVIASVETYAREISWADENVEYAGFLSVLAHWRMGDAAGATAVLDHIAEAVDRKSWAASLTEYLQDKISESALMQRASSNGNRTEAHFYPGVRAAIANRREQALGHLRWIKERGERNYSEYSMALDELARLEDGGLTTLQ
jgi:tetratricopeptide (TPR) repeat protein